MPDRANIPDRYRGEAQLPSGVYRIRISCASETMGHCQIKSGSDALADLSISGGSASEIIRHPGGPISFVCDSSADFTVEIELPL